MRGYVVAWFVLDEGEIGNLAVAGEARRHGIGARLLDAAIDAVGTSDVDTLYLEVRELERGRAGAVRLARLRRGWPAARLLPAAQGGRLVLRLDFMPRARSEREGYAMKGEWPRRTVGAAHAIALYSVRRVNSPTARRSI